jgi:HD superfamily phosphohydrolase
MTEKVKVPNDVKKLLEEQASEEVKTLKSELEELKKKIAESDKEKLEMGSKISHLSRNQLSDFVTDSLKWWMTPCDSKSLPEGMGIVDPIYGYITIEKELVPLLMHPLVQRLNFVRQLSFSYLEFPTAQHTRLSHSLGVCKNTELALDAIFRLGKLYSSGGERSISLTMQDMRKTRIEAKAAGLLHDIGHAPYGHCVDRYIGLKKEIPYFGHFDKYFSREYTLKYLQNLLKESGFDTENLIDILSPDKTNLSGFSELVSQIIDSPLDVDRMDYLVRDAHLSGLPLGFINVKQIIESIRPFVNNDHYSISYALDAMYHIEHFLYARDAMYVNCYESPKKTAAEGMMITALKDFDDTYDIPLENMILLSDHQLLSTLVRFSSPSSPSSQLALKIIKGEIFIQVYELALLSEKAQQNSEIKNFIDSMARSEKKTTVFLQRPNEWRDILAKGANLKEAWKILITMPPPDAYHPKEIGVDLLCRKGSGYATVKLADESDIVTEFLKIQTKARLKLRVFVSPDLPEAQRSIVRDVARKNFETS